MARTKGFQSLFSWMTLIGSIQELGAAAAGVFQSLFSWMTLIGCPGRARVRAAGLRFNPCFLG